MGSRRVPALIALVLLVGAVVVFLVVGGGGEGDPATTTPATTGEAEGERSGGGGEERDREPKPAEPEVPVIRIEGGAPVGGVSELEFERGGRIRFDVRADEAAHVHLHGYDVFKDVPPGGRTRFDVPATIDGVFEVEIETTATPLAEVTVNPG